MIVVLEQYNRLATDANGNVMPIGERLLASEGKTAAATFTALSDDTKFICVLTDTAIHINLSGAADASDPLVLTERWFKVQGGEEPQFIAA